MRRLSFVLALAFWPSLAPAQSSALLFFMRANGRRIDAHDVAVMRRRVSIHMQDVAIPAMLDSIAGQAQLHIAYSPNERSRARRASRSRPTGFPGRSRADRSAAGKRPNRFDVEVLPGDQISAPFAARSNRRRRVASRAACSTPIASEPVVNAQVLVTGTNVGTITKATAARSRSDSRTTPRA